MAGLQAIQLEAGASAIIGQREGVNGELGQRFFRAAVLFGWLVVPLLDGEVVGADVLTFFNGLRELDLEAIVAGTPAQHFAGRRVVVQQSLQVPSVMPL